MRNFFTVTGFLTKRFMPWRHLERRPIRNDVRPNKSLDASRIRSNGIRGIWKMFQVDCGRVNSTVRARGRELAAKQIARDATEGDAARLCSWNRRSKDYGLSL